jgi:hypothetical protein
MQVRLKTGLSGKSSDHPRTHSSYFFFVVDRIQRKRLSELSRNSSGSRSYSYQRRDIAERMSRHFC